MNTTIKQNIRCETASIITVLLLPISMISFANSKTGVFVGICLLLMILYGIYNIYKTLYGKELLVNSTKLVYKNFDTIKEISYKEIIDVEIQKGFLNSLCSTETFILHLEKEDISLVNVRDTTQVQKYIKNNKKG